MSSANRGRWRLPGTHQTRSGVGPTMTGSLASSSPTTKATRDGEIRIVSANAAAFLPGPAGVSPTTRVFDTATKPSAMTRVAAKTAFSAGSSQHGKHRRAPVASNWVAAMAGEAPAASLYVLREE